METGNNTLKPTPQEEFNELTPATDIAGLNSNILFILEQYGSRKMGVIVVFQYLTERRELGKQWLSDNGINNSQELEKKLHQLQAKARTGKGKARQQARTDLAVDNIMRIAEKTYMNERQNNAEYAVGGHVASRGNNHPGDATKGGVFKGNSHANGGIKAVIKHNNQPIEVEGGEVIITKAAVNDNTTREFEGEKLTNKQILSRINQDGGGVPIFEDGGDIAHHTCGCTGRKYNFGGKLMTDYEIVSAMSSGTPATISSRKKAYRQLPRKVKKYSNEAIELSECEKLLFYKFKTGKLTSLEVGRDKMPLLRRLEDRGFIYAVPVYGALCMEVRLTEMGNELIESHTPGYFETDLKMDCGCDEHTKSIFKDGGATISEIASEFPNVSIVKINPGAESKYKYYKGVGADYENQFTLNKAIEELLDNTEFDDDLTTDEKNFLTYFAGYGGLEKQGATGKGLLYEYFTPGEIAKRMWGLAYKHGFKGGEVIEPSCGIGEFIKYAPEQRLVTGYEINPISARIARILYPEAEIATQAFETLFVRNNSSVKSNIKGMNSFSLVIGNPPYGSMAGIYAGMGEKSYTKANNYIDYFITRGLDLLKTDGLLIYIIGTEVAAGGIPFLAQNTNPVKKAIAAKADLVDAYRLPNGLFERTDVLTDIVVFKKK